MKLTLEYGANCAREPIMEALAGAGIQLDGTVRKETWPDDLELQAAGELDHARLRRAVGALTTALCADWSLVPVRILRDPDVADLLFGIPCDDWERATKALDRDIQTYSEDADPFRAWFRGRWMGQRDEDALTYEELSSTQLTPERILKFLDPSEFRDWRPIQTYVARAASCEQLAEAMAKAETPTQKWRLAYAFHRRGRSCEAAVPLLMRYLQDSDRRVREEAADSLGRVVLAIRHPDARSRWGRLAGEALLTYVTDHPEDGLYFARTALGATGYEPARGYLEDQVRNGSGQQLESAKRGLANLDESKRRGSPAYSPL